MYGQDADLIMLALCSHEPHFTLLREIVDFGFGGMKNENEFKAVTKFTKTSDFQLLHISILREYIGYEFQGPDSGIFDLERIIDDWIFLTFLVGNDFLPHMASLDIGDGAFDLLFNTYKEQRNSWGPGEYLTKEGEIADMNRLEKYLAIIGAAENDILEARETADAKYMKKKRKWDKKDGKAAGPSDEELMAIEESKQHDYMTMINGILLKHGPNGNFVDGWTLPTAERKDFKGRYYFEKLNLTPLDIDSHYALRKAYIEGLVWCLAYYTKGCISWGWFFPYHYGMCFDLLLKFHLVNDIHQ
jgi:5'-3' exoribonuclease 1